MPGREGSDRRRIEASAHHHRDVFDIENLPLHRLIEQLGEAFDVLLPAPQAKPQVETRAAEWTFAHALGLDDDHLAGHDDSDAGEEGT